VPRSLRANSQLNSAVRAPPTCKYPVGEGANRTRTLPFCVPLASVMVGCFSLSSPKTSVYRNLWGPSNATLLIVRVFPNPAASENLVLAKTALLKISETFYNHSF